MKNKFKPGDKKKMQYIVKNNDVAAFNGEVVHSVCSTFTLAREIEWTTRQFVLEMREDDEEGIGTFLSIDHKGPAFINDAIEIEATVDGIHGHELVCSYIARVGEQVIATGKTGQKILKREKMAEIFSGRTMQ